MRKITKSAVDAFMMPEPFSQGNTRVTCDDDINLYLHNNLIASWNPITGQLWVTDAGWPTMTTKERLNGIPGVNIVQKAGQWYLNGKEWNGNLIEVQ